MPGVNVWSQKWRDVQGATIAQRLDNIPYGSQGGFNVYEIDGPNGPLHFVAGEVSNQIYAFYLSDTSGQNC